jgi:preprotein translocase subunit SecG
MRAPWTKRIGFVMQNVILVIHILACLVMIGLVLVQKSEGGGLGIGGGGGGGANSLLSGRGAAGAIVRSTIIFGAIFFITSLALTTLANRETDTRSDIERVLAPEDTTPAPEHTHRSVRSVGSAALGAVRPFGRECHDTRCCNGTGRRNGRGCG